MSSFLFALSATDGSKLDSLKVASSIADIADIAGGERIQSEHILEAIHYRSLDRKLFS